MNEYKLKQVHLKLKPPEGHPIGGVLNPTDNAHSVPAVEGSANDMMIAVLAADLRCCLVIQGASDT